MHGTRKRVTPQPSTVAVVCFDATSNVNTRFDNSVGPLPFTTKNCPVNYDRSFPEQFIDVGGESLKKPVS